MYSYALPPTLNEVIIYFCSSALPHFQMYDPKFNYLDLDFNFVEKEAKDLIKNIYKKYNLEATDETFDMFCKKIDNPYNDNFKTVVVRDYKEFFNLLTRLYELDIDKYIKHERSSYGIYRMKNFFKDVWLRASNLDFQDINNFLKKEISMYENDIFHEYDEEYYLGKYNSDKGILLSCHNKISKPWDECPYEMIFGLYPESLYEESNSCFLSFPSYELPKVRYGIYEENGEKICRIGSIQKDIYNINLDDRTSKIAKRMRYKLSNDDGIEPDKIISLFLFINLLKNKGITKIEIPSLYPLDYDYHITRSKYLKKDLIDNWTPFRIECDPERFAEAKRYFLDNYGAENKISKIKTEDLINVALRTCSYIDTSYVLDIDSRIFIDVGHFNKDNISNKLLSNLSLEVESSKDKKYVKKNESITI